MKKKFRFSEFFAEKIITMVAFLSIAVIVLIFLFVFRETLPIFKASPVQTIVNNEQLVPESYSSRDTELKPETYGEINTSESNELKPEQYGVITDTITSESENISFYDEEPNRNIANENNNQGAWKTFNTKDWYPVSDNPRFGFWPLIVGTFKVTIIAILIAAPIAILAALFTSAFASRRLREIIKPAIELLASFPSVVIGFFALMVMATFFQDVLGYSSRLNAFIGGAAMALAAIPVIYTITEDALSAVPKSYTEASLALGANKWQTAFFIILPAATPGIFAALLLGIGRVFGETMIALMATGNAALISANPFDSVRTLSATIGAEMAEVVFGDTHYSVLFLIGSLLFIFTFMLNAIAEFYIKGKLIRKIQGR
ncbi:MAG: phosphate ABC transporter permease subunit PstC [Bacteroidetes bacterium GWA2_30_7]|nr:MAG: phosphate ABC transporter permease subunit PstC [Bacteroidetes bacterium GWA2_30_7]